MNALFGLESLRRLERETPGARPTLMERAGQATAALAAQLAGDAGAPILVVAGPGRNGGDAWIAAARLVDAFHRVTVLDAGTGEPPTAEAREAKGRFSANRGEVVHEWPATLAPALIVDGLLGIGLARDVEEPLRKLIDRINAAGCPVLAIDVPSGVDAATGAVRGLAVRATHTLTFLGDKPGLHTGAGLDRAGRVHVDTLGVDGGAGDGDLLDAAAIRDWLAPRSRDSHKGSFGTLGVIGGARGMVGAAVLAARAGLLGGAGKVYLALLSPDAPAYDAIAPELMMRSVDDTLGASVLVVGPGAGMSTTATSRSAFERSVLPACINAERPLVLDADALNVLALHKPLQLEVAARGHPTILTPHPGEAARLLDIATAQVQEDRIDAAVQLAERFRAEVVLKGAGSVCASPGGRWSVNTTGNPGLASGGTGDVLAGLVGALLCQGLDAPQALRYAVCLHGAAADACAAAGEGPVGLTASDVLRAARRVLNQWTSPEEAGP